MSFDILCPGKPFHVEPGIFRGMPRSEYDRIPALSSTVIRKWLRLQSVPSVFKHWLDHRFDEDQPVSEALLIGSALDCVRLENGSFLKRYVTVPPDAPKKPSKAQLTAKKNSPESAAAIAWWHKFNEESAGKTLLTHDQMRVVLGMDRALAAAPTLDGVFDNCSKTVLVGELFGQPAKAEIDLWSEKSDHIMDIKTAMDVTENGFVGAVEKFQYLEQATWYLLLAQSLGVEKNAFDFIAVGNDEPYPVKVHSFVTDSIDEHVIAYAAAKQRIKNAVQTLALACETGEFKDDQDWRPIRLNEWTISRARKELETLYDTR